MKRPGVIFTVVLLALAMFMLGACRGEGEGDDRIAGVIHRLLVAAGTEGTEALESYPGALPGDIPALPPIYPGADLLVTNRQPAPFTDVASASSDVPQPVLYFIVLDTPDDRQDVFAFYQDALDQEPWQLQSSFSTEQLDTLQFFNVKDIDIGGVVSIAEGGADGRTSVLISLQDAGAFLEEEPPFVLPASLALPNAFPPDVPLFEDATVTGTAFFREPGLESFLVVFLTTSSQDDVLKFYRETFQDNGWRVQDTGAFGLEGRIDFRDTAGDVQGDVFADRYSRSRRYTEVSLQIQIDPARDVPGSLAEEPVAETPADEAEAP